MTSFFVVFFLRLFEDPVRSKVFDKVRKIFSVLARPAVDEKYDPVPASNHHLSLWQRIAIDMLKKLKWAVPLIFLLIPVATQAAIEYKSVLKADIKAPILDVAASPDEDMVFLLTPEVVLIYSTEKQAVLDRIPLKEPYDRIAYQETNRLVLTAAKPSRINIIHFSRIFDIDVSGRAIEGPPDAKVHLVIFDDYQCPYCARLQPFVEQILKKFPKDVNCAIKFFPIASHKFSRQAAMAALAAEKQGKFWEFHTQLLKNYNRLNEAKILEIAKNLGLDMQRFNQDRQLAASRELIRKDIEEGRKIGVNGTPSVFLNGKQIRNRDLGTLPKLIEDELGK
jgi:glutaredoxin